MNCRMIETKPILSWIEKMIELKKPTFLECNNFSRYLEKQDNPEIGL